MAGMLSINTGIPTSTSPYLSSCNLMYHLFYWLLWYLCSTLLGRNSYPVLINCKICIFCYSKCCLTVVLFSSHNIFKSMFLYPNAFISITQSLSWNFSQNFTASAKNRYAFLLSSCLLLMIILVIKILWTFKMLKCWSLWPSSCLYW